MSHFLPLLLLLAVLIAGARLGGIAASRLRQPAVFGELLAGVLVGPSLLDLLHWDYFHEPVVATFVRDVAGLGAIFLMFLAGLESDLGQMRAVGRPALLGAAGGVLLPFAGGYALARLWGFGAWEGAFVGTILTATSVSISAQTLMDMRRLRTREGAAILGAAVIDDVLAVLVLSLVLALHPAAGGGGGTGLVAVREVVVKIALFFGAVFLSRRVLYRLVELATRAGIHQTFFTFVVVAALGYSWAAEALGGVAAITGAYLAGVLFQGTGHRELIEDRIRPFAYAFFVPVFLVGIGLEADVGETVGDPAFVGLVTVLAVVSKLAGVLAGGMAAGFGFTPSLRFGVGMISRGEIAMIIAILGLERGIIDERVFSAMVIMTLVTTVVTPVLLRLSFRERARRAH